jgi:hypothetical protein
MQGRSCYFKNSHRSREPNARLYRGGRRKAWEKRRRGPAERGSAAAGAAAAVAETGAASQPGTIAAIRSSSRDRSSSHVRREAKARAEATAGAAAVSRSSGRHCSNWSRQPSRDRLAAVRSSSRCQEQQPLSGAAAVGKSGSRIRSSSHGKSRSHGRSSSCRQEQHLWARAAGAAAVDMSSSCRQKYSSHQIKKVSKSGILTGEDLLTRNFMSIISVGRPYTHTRIALIREFKIKFWCKLSTCALIVVYCSYSGVFCAHKDIILGKRLFLLQNITICALTPDHSCSFHTNACKKKEISRCESRALHMVYRIRSFGRFCQKACTFLMVHLRKTQGIPHFILIRVHKKHRFSAEALHM